MTFLEPKAGSPACESPFYLDNQQAYREWRARKLEDYPTSVNELLVELADPRSLTRAEQQALLNCCRKTNMALYVSGTGSDPDKGIPLQLGRQLGLHRLDRNWLADDDGISPLAVAQTGPRRDYIPYTNRPIRWHTDGYYNPRHRQIQSLLLHCVSSAASDGENALLDHEIAYILLRDENPEFISVLMAPDAMTIPARLDKRGVARPDETGPVFSVHVATGDLHMRYTARTRSIRWKQNALTQAAVEFLRVLLDSDSSYLFRGRLEPGMGLVSNNVLHDRAGFTDDASRQRLLYRARYFDRIEGTGLREVYG